MSDTKISTRMIIILPGATRSIQISDGAAGNDFNIESVEHSICISNILTQTF
jgi:hypothetical protein